MADPTAPVTADDLRDRIIHAIGSWQHESLEASADAVLDEVTPELERLRAELVKARSRASDLSKKEDREFRRAEQAEAERDALKAAIAAAMRECAAHIKEFHPTRMHNPDCAGCRIGLVLSRERPAKLDSPEAERAEEPGVPTDWQAVVRERERELKKVAEERHALKAAVENAMQEIAAHRQKARHILDPDCDACRIGVTLSRDLPRTPDSREEIQTRIAALDTPGGPDRG